MKKVLFGLAFFGAMAFTGITAQGQGSVDPGEGEETRCYQRMYWCAGEIEAYNCENVATGYLCSQSYVHCYKCS
ncbi:MAG: hypothetical protein ACQEW9_14295 [Bacteroidota bacterium]